MGAEFLDEWRNVRVDGEALRRLAGIPGSAAADLSVADQETEASQ
jgi:hypothetical protein